MKFAIINASGTQYKVEEGQQVVVNKLSQKRGDIIEFSPLLVFDGKRLKVGKPYVARSKVKTKVLGHEKGDKLRVSRYHAKSRYRRVVGYKPYYTRLQVISIS